MVTRSLPNGNVSRSLYFALDYIQFQSQQSLALARTATQPVQMCREVDRVTDCISVRRQQQQCPPWTVCVRQQHRNSPNETKTKRRAETSECIIIALKNYQLICLACQMAFSHLENSMIIDERVWNALSVQHRHTQTESFWFPLHSRHLTQPWVFGGAVCMSVLNNQFRVVVVVHTRSQQQQQHRRQHQIIN